MNSLKISGFLTVWSIERISTKFNLSVPSKQARLVASGVDPTHIDVVLENEFNTYMEENDLEEEEVKNGLQKVDYDLDAAYNKDKHEDVWILYKVKIPTTGYTGYNKLRGCIKPESIWVVKMIDE